MKRFAQNNSVESEESIIEECDYFGINYEYEMKQLREKEKKQTKDDTESLEEEFKDDINLYSQGLSGLSREEINEKYKALGIKINIDFSRTDIKKVASDVSAREVQSSKSRLNKDYNAVINPEVENKTLNE